jgi:ABC-type Mn2+/Zn2+ transport system permease subunit
VYDLIFYITFGVVVVNTVPILGIFLVFMLLIGPAVVVRFFTSDWKKRIFWSWMVGTTASVTGILLSYILNISNGPTIVCVLGILALLAGFIGIFRKRSGNHENGRLPHVN